jgi:D-glycero-D-manno-heptose 1,7-bisphosphate phosphatase
MQKVIFLDRDGTINHDSPSCIKSWAEFEFLPGSLEALVALTRHGFHPILVTNQSSVNRGMVPLSELQNIHRRLSECVAAAGGRIFDTFFCPHRPDENCACRKPKPGLIRLACARHGIDAAQSYMIGDSARDILCGRNAGCGANILVLTGNGPAARRDLAEEGVCVDAVVDDLYQAVQLILNRPLIGDIHG